MRNLLLGQCLSLAITLSSAVNEILNRIYDLNFSAVLTFIFYLALFFIFAPFFLLKRKTGSKSNSEGIRIIFKTRAFVYMAYAFFDCFASLTVVLAYSFVNMSLITLLSTASTPFVIFFSKMFLKTTFTIKQYVGAFTCIFAILILSMALGFDSLDSTRSITGCLLCLISSISYAASNILAEKLSKSSSSHFEFLAFTSLFGIFWSIFGLFVRSDEIFILIRQPLMVFLLIGMYVSCLIVFYWLIPIFLINSSATLFNLSLFTVNVYSFLIGYIFFHIHFIWAYPLAFALIATGIILYSAEPSS